MQVGLLTPPGLLGPLVSRALATSGHELTVAATLDALLAQAASPCEVVLFAPWLQEGEAAEVLRQARDDGIAPPHSIYLGLDAAACEAARAAGFDKAFVLPFSAPELLSAIDQTARGQPRILVVDDSDLIHRHTGTILREAGYEVLRADDGEEGLAMVRRESVDLVLTDVEMPRLDGYGLCQAIKGEPATAHLPIVICSSLGEAADLERGFDAGADDYLVKPVVAEELLSRVHEILALRMAASRERVLVVDDSAAIRHLVADCLRRQGFAVETAVDGTDGLDRAAKNPPDLVLTDYDMPNMTGYELVHALRRDLATRDVPIVMLTARDSRRDQAQMRAAGLTSYLIKPFSTDKCIAIVERVLAEARLRRYKEASRLYISEGAVEAAEDQARSGELFTVRAREADATLLFSDISGFTAMSTTMTPRDVVGILNEVFDVLCPVIKSFGGDIDKFIGDAIMAIFEDRPTDDEPHALRAARAAWAMQQALVPFAEGPMQLSMRIGLNCGPIVRGDIGSRFVRRDYTAIGDTVNRAQRYEAMAPKGGVLMSAALYDRLRDQVVVEEVTGIKLKGITHPVSAYVLKGFVG